jgi:exodeoxyribonuclease VII small subunit
MAETTPIKDLPFEQALAELERIVQQLERGDVALEDSIRIYERGAALKAHCEARLREAQMKVEQIVLGPDGQPSGSKSFES